ncbi:exopolysaccharide biosynthesis polyprenyl glycosylphosphotransferase [Oribacterium sp. KHPX15]|uniref:sugar transferase n=1 Tax=Oribacterium sp. KHPX15 TaxID=1855342 RepID=UPI000894CE58|nr:sugar transferase [Oribacterium sp. KHPX15]SEA56762.1 exopolysaccharide biosynthesis polyprenyl glycosylphosphotransferase [Oribacterium sp. KHPX15]
MKRKKLELAITIVIYILTAFLASAGSLYVLRAYSKLTKEVLEMNLWFDAVLPAVLAECIAMSLSLLNGKYEFERKNIWDYAITGLKSTVYFVGIWAAILLIQKNDITQSRYFFVATVVLHFAILTILLFMVQRIVISKFYKSDAASLVAVITDREKAHKASEILKNDWSRRIVGIMLTDEEGSAVAEAVTEIAGSANSKKSSDARKRMWTEGTGEEIDHIPVVAYKDDIVNVVRAGAIDELFILEDESSEKITAMVEEFAQMGISVHLGLSSLRNLEMKLRSEDQKYIPKIESRLGYIGKYPMAILEPPVMKLRYEYAKRFIDILGGLVGTFIAAVLFVIVGIAIKLDSPGPIIFAQERIGKNGRRFKMFKFRSMYIDAEERKAELMKQNEMNGLMFKMKDDPRITKVGKFIRKTSLDEFPQFVNVLLGDMSLVGTRPPTVNEFKEYSNYHKRRLSMKPGITGMWQVSGRSDITDFEEVVRLDCKYIDNWSLWLDFQILVKTVLAVVMRKGSE